MKRVLALVVVLFGISCADANDPAIRPNSLIFNQTFPLTSGHVVELPLYLTRRGEYYAQAILERADGTERPLAVNFDLNVQIDRDEKLLFERSLTTQLGRERPVATLFWITSDREVPIKTPLTMALGFSEVQADDGEIVRIQVRRKHNRSRLF